MDVAIVIPARMSSTRFPNKPFASIRGMSMIERVWRIGQKAAPKIELFIATDDPGLKQFAESFGARVIMTRSDCISGTDRVAEAIRLLGNRHSLIFNLQGDAVLTPPWVIAAILQAMLVDPTIEMATPAVHLSGKALSDFVALKRSGVTSGSTVVFDKKGDALYFSKTLIPFYRDENSPIYRHIGLYGYRRETLEKLMSLPEGPLERAEKLEQLRALENQIPIRVVPVDYQGRTHGSVDRFEDIAFVEEAIDREGELI